MSLLRISSRFEQRTFWRSREAAVFIFIFPLLLYALLGSRVLGRDRRRSRPPTSCSPGSSATARRTPPSPGSRSSSSGGARLGILKRLRATPLPPWTYLAAVLLSTLVVFALQAVALLALGALAFGASTPENPLGFAGAVVLGVACFAGMGVGAAALIRSAEGVSAVVNVIVLPMAFLSGSFGPTDEYPAFLQAIADVLPLTYFLDIVYGIYLDGESLFADPRRSQSSRPGALPGLVVALRWFGWVPRETIETGPGPKARPRLYRERVASGSRAARGSTGASRPPPARLRRTSRQRP